MTLKIPMAISFSLSLLMALITTTSLLFSTSATPSTPHPPARPPPPPPAFTPQTPPRPPVSTAQRPPTSAEIQENQLKNIIDALIGADDFGGWANVLSSADASAFPLTATFFIPSNDATSHLASAAVADAGNSFDPLLVPYHIVPQRLAFSDLQQFTTHTRLPTLLPSKYIVITNNSTSNFTVDDSQITQPDIFLNAAFSVHGINKILDYSVYGGSELLSPPPETSKPQSPELAVEQPKKRNHPVFPGEITVGARSGAPCSCSAISMILSTFFAVIFVQDSSKFTGFI